MAKFKYTARDRSGKATQGAIQAEDEVELRRILRMNDLYLTDFRGRAAATAQTSGDGLTFFEPRVKLQDLVILTREFATMVRAGLPMMETLRVISDQTEKPALKRAFHDLEQAVAEGRSLSSGMRKHPKIFNMLVVSLVEAGETAGTLDQTLDVAADQLNREMELKRKVQAATLYPKLVVLACIGTIAGMLTLVVPVFAKVYSDVRASLPSPTLLLIAISDLVTHWLWAILLTVGVCWYSYKRYSQTVGGKRRIDIISLKLPVLGPVFRKIAISRVVMTLGGAFKGGVPILESLAIAANTSGNTVIRDAVTDVARNVRDGARLATEFEKTGQFPIMVTRMLAAGEATGNVDQMLEEVNKFYEKDIEYAVDQLTRMIEPLMTILVGLIVLLILLALYMPIFNLGPTLLKH